MASHDKAQATTEQMIGAVKDKAEQARKTAEDTAQAAKDKLAGAAQVAKDKSLETTQAAKDMTNDTSKAAGDKATESQENAGSYLDMAKGKVADISQVICGNAQGGVKNTGGFLQATSDTVVGAATGVSDGVKNTLGFGPKK